MNVANLITVLRFPLLVAVVLLLYHGGSRGQLVDVLLIAVLMLMDSLDGIVARRRGEQSPIGGALDIATDRAVEIVLWVSYAHLRLVPVGIALTVVIRGALTDSVRNLALVRGRSAHAMMRTSWGRWLVASSSIRGGYGIVKLLAFVLLAITLGLRTASHPGWRSVHVAALAVSWVALGFCILRGFPVLVEAPRLLQPAHADEAGAAARSDE